MKNGSIVELDPISKKTRIIYSSLSVDDHLLNCGKINTYEFNPFNNFKTFISGQDNLEHVCGRPLGIRRFSDDELIIVQAYHGIFKLNVKTSMLLKRN